ncbi:hypothetical protein LAV_00023 [Sphingobium phage Lacusarx]|uniref:Uncharacterized protein n=1 Tax=Sphingobium phage Lacusarx TaxID=1980139 RepID=A0A1W6DWX7_9CAUD|nr:tail protein [Sphingobium phage Lacusarx]ARK07423.1 hypothetical protein LAV_00023 [Sphingobium phage Lacusarx]
MGQMVMTIAGAAIGSIIPGVGTAVGAMVGGALGGMLFGPTIKGPRLTDLTVTASTYGNEIPHLYGTMRMSGNVIWSAGIKEHKKKKKAGKGGPKQTTYTYTCSFAVAFCRGPVQKVLRIWADSKMVEIKGLPGGLSFGSLLTAFVQNKSGSKGGVKVRFYSGSEEQLPDSVIEQTLGAGNVPAYRGLCYLVFENLPLEDYGNRIPSITAELTAYANQELVRQAFKSIGNKPDTYGRYVDWTNRRAVASGGDTVSYNIDTGDEVLRFPGGAGGSANMGALGGPLVSQADASNTVRAVVYNPNTGQSHLLGAQSRSLGYGGLGGSTQGLGSDIQRSSERDKPQWGFPWGSYWSFPVATLAGYKYAIICQGSWGDAVTMMVDSGGGYYHSFIPPFRVQNFILGSVSQFTEVWGWGNGVGGVPGIIGSGLGIVRHTFGAGTTFAEGQPYKWTIRKGSVSTKYYQVMRDGIPSGYSMLVMTADNALYCPSDNSFVFTGGLSKGTTFVSRYFGKYSIDNKKWTYFKTGTEYEASAGGSWSMANHQDQTIGYISASRRYKVIDLSTGDMITDADSQLGNYPWNSCWDDVTNSMIYWTRAGEFVRASIGAFGGPVSVAAVVTDICTRTGLLTSADLDTSELTDDEITGFIMSRGSAKGSLQILSNAFLFDGVESDFKLKFRKRGGTSKMTIPQDRIAWVEEGKLFNETRTQEVELPARLTVSFRDPARDYQTGTQHAKRLIGPVATAFTRTETQVEFAMAFSATQAKQLADKMLKSIWRNRTTIELNLPWEFVVLDPADVVTLALNDGTTFSLRVVQMDQGADKTIKMSLTTESQTSYVSNEVATPPNNFITQPLPSNLPAKLLVMNTPLLRDEDDTQGVRSLLYLAAYQESNAAFSSVVIQQSDTDTEYDDIDLVTDDPYTGTVLKPLNPTSSWGSTDTESELTVKMWNMNEDVTLSSISLEELYAGGNAALCGDEIIQFQNAVLISNDQYKLTNILRARRGTNMHVNTHVVGERFVMLDPTYIVTNERGPADFSMRRYYKAVRNGQMSEELPATQMQIEPNDLKPYTPESVKLSEVDGTVTISWKRRSRITANLVDGTGEIHYKEGLGLLASYGYRIHKDRDLEDSPWTSYALDTPTGKVPFYDTANTALPSEKSFAIAELITGETGTFVLELWENGFVEGFHKIVQFTRVAPGEWDATELY